MFELRFNYLIERLNTIFKTEQHISFCHCLTSTNFQQSMFSLESCTTIIYSKHLKYPPPRAAVNNVQKCQAEYNGKQTLSSLIHGLVCHLLFAMFTINHTYFKHGNVQLVFFDKTSFYFQVSEVKGLKRENRVEENICKTFKKKKKK